MCSAFTPDCGFDNSTNVLIGDVSCPNTKCSGRPCLHKKRLLNLSAEAIINDRIARLCARCAIFFLKIKEIPSPRDFTFLMAKGLTFLKRAQTQFKILLEMSISWQVLFQQIEMRIPCWFCNNSKIHLCLWKKWSLVFCSQSSVYDTGARKDDKNRQKTLFLCRKDEIGTQQTIVTHCPISINQI